MVIAFVVGSILAEEYQRLAIFIAELNEVRADRRQFEHGAKGLSSPEGDSRPWLMIAGKVRLLEAAPGKPDVACYRIRRNDGIYLERTSHCGRFLIESDDDTVLVDEDFFRLLPPPGKSHRASLITLRDGMSVRAYGPVEMCAVAELGLENARNLQENTGYRGAQEMRRFAGCTGSLVLIQPLGESSG